MDRVKEALGAHVPRGTLIRCVSGVRDADHKLP